MKFVFLLRFFTRPGEEIRVAGNIPELGSGMSEGGVAMHYLDDRFWRLEVDIPAERFQRAEPLRYRYIFHPAGRPPVTEWERDRCLAGPLFAGASSVVVTDTWNHAGDVENVFYTAPFRQVLLPVPADAMVPMPGSATHVFRVKAPCVGPDEALCLTGSGVGLGSWDRGRVLPMRPVGDWWEVAVDLGADVLPLTYKYGVMHAASKRLTRYEEGSNRILEGVGEATACHVLHDGFARLPNDGFRAAGIAIPVFSLRSTRGLGVGEFPDIRLLVDWAVKTGIRMIQLLPVNDTTSKGTWEDSYPYAAISAFALHPMYLDLERVAGADHRDLLGDIDAQRQALQELPVLDYERVMRIKLGILDALSLRCAAETLQTEGFRLFFEQNCHWLEPYAAFCYLRDRYGTPDTSRWKTHARYDEAAVRKLCDPRRSHYRQIARHYFTQYHLHLQLRDAHAYANANGVILKGDIPIGVSRHGVETWMEPQFFHLDRQAGAPPDDFAVKGQNWDFPTYDWDRMKQDGFAWWKRRFEQMSRYYDAFRIDHILGFFRIWSIPVDAVEGILGRFVPAIPVHATEFEAMGIPVDVQRFCRPWIDDAVLWEMFGPFHQQVRPYLRKRPDGRYELLESCDTQRKVIALLAADDNLADRERLQQSLFDLISNVILFEEPASGGTRFHFRFRMEDTASWRHLDAPVRERLRECYVDYFFRRQDANWRREAMEKLPALKRCTDMLICGEDLGLVPDCVPDVMRQLGILSMEVQRMPKDPAVEFFQPATAPYLSVVTPSSHDMSTLREWWTEDPQRTQRFFTHALGQYSRAPETCEPWVCTLILQQHLQSPAQWAVFQLQDLLSMDGTLRRDDPSEERINIPANPRHYWRYRMHLTLERLLQETGFQHSLRSMLEAAGRDTNR